MKWKAHAALLVLLVPAVLVTAPTASAASPGFAWGSDLSQWHSLGDATRAEAMGVSVATGMTVIGTDAKDGGPVGWSTTSFPTFTTLAPGDGAVERVTRDAHAKGLRVAARFDVFEDSVAASKWPYASLGGSPVWVDPACPEVRAFALAQVKDLVTRVPIDEINFDHVRYPDARESGKTALPCTASGADRSAIVASWVEEASAAARAARPGIVVSISVFGYTMRDDMPEIGQDAALLAPHVDILRPMLYPSYFSSAAVSDPYTAVKESTSAGVQRFGAAKVQPWIQGFDAYATRPDLVCAQYKGIVDAGATGGLVWWFPSTGTTRAFWDKVSPCVPKATDPTTSATTTTTTSGYAVTFTPKAGNEWWVETAAASAQGVAGVSASVNGGTPVALTKNSWGTWSKSFHVPSGSLVKFTATSSTGATNVSASYAWPGATLASTGPSPAPSSFAANFTKIGANARWVEVRVAANEPLAGVTATIGTKTVALAPTSWGTWGKAVHVKHGSTVVFTATSTTGAKATSAPFAWP